MNGENISVPFFSFSFFISADLCAGLRRPVETEEGEAPLRIGRKEHPAGLDPHQLRRLQVGDDDDGLPDGIQGNIAGFFLCPTLTNEKKNTSVRSA